LAYCTDIWWIAVAVEVFFLALVIAALKFFERFSFYQRLFVEKAKHEVIVSFITLFSLIAVLLAVFWGALGAEHKYAAIAAIMAWGPGDAVAAIVGKHFGRHKLQGKMIEGVKSVEGSVGMAVASFLCVLPILLLASGHPWYVSLAFSVLIAPIASLTELFTKRGWDTVTVPLVSALVLSISFLWG
jgi:dolichol kinase